MTTPKPQPALSSFEALAESAPDAIITINEESRILFANSAVERIFGYDRETLTGQRLTILIPERLRPSHERGIARYLQTGRRNISWTGTQLPALRRDGREIPVEISFGEFVDDSGRRVFSGFIRDVSERQQLLEESKRARAEAEAAVLARDEVLSIVSHDLRNPVSAVAMSAELLIDPEIPLTEEQRRTQLGVIARSAQRMSRLIQDLLDVARIEGGRLSITCRCEDPGPIAAEACEAFRAIAAEKNIALECDVDTPLRQVYLDRDRVLQALSNYLNNALKFSPADGRIMLRVRDLDGSGVQYAVTDNGPGIAAEELGNVFKRFWQAKRSAHLGSGLGLAITQGIAEAHRGRVRVESTPGVETTFYLELPLSKECG